MSTNRLSNIIGSKRYKLSPNANTNIQIQLESGMKPLTEYDVIDIVNQETLFNEEREASKKYRINGKLNIYTGNELSPTATNKYWDPLFYGTPPSPANWVMQLTYPSENDYDLIVGNNQAFRGLDYVNLSITFINGDNKLTVAGKQNHNLVAGDFIYLYSNTFYNPFQGFHEVLEVGIDGDNLEKNITLNTVSNNISINNKGSFVRVLNTSFNDVTFNNPSTIVSMVATDISGNTTGSYIANETRYTTITTSFPHNLIINNFVDIRIPSINIINGLWKVYNIVSPTKFVIRLFSSNTKGQITNFNTPPKWRLLDGTPSEYYVRKFEVLTTNDYSVYPCSYSETIFNLGVSNNTWLFQFNQDINIKNIVDNRKGEISELYYTIIKRSGSKPYPWGTITSHWDFNRNSANLTNFVEEISKSRVNTIGTIEKLSARTETIVNGEVQAISGSKYIGDFVEFNTLEILEKTCAEIINRIDIIGETEGYYYKPFKKLQIRKYSNVIEYASANETVLNLPSNYVTYSDGSIAWRDLLPVGFYQENDNGVEYPFLNDAHYFYFNHNLYVRRQDPKNIINVSDQTSIDPNNLNVEC